MKRQPAFERLGGSLCWCLIIVAEMEREGRKSIVVARRRRRKLWERCILAARKIMISMGWALEWKRWARGKYILDARCRYYLPTEPRTALADVVLEKGMVDVKVEVSQGDAKAEGMYEMVGRGKEKNVHL